MSACHVDPLSDGVLVGSHWAGRPLQLPQGDTHKLVDSVETSPSALVPPGGATGFRFTPYTLACLGGLWRAGPLAFSLHVGKWGRWRGRVYVHESHHEYQDTHTHIFKSNETNVWQDVLENGYSVRLQETDGLGSSLWLWLTIIVIIDYFWDKSDVCLVKNCHKTEQFLAQVWVAWCDDEMGILWYIYISICIYTNQ